MLNLLLAALLSVGSAQYLFPVNKTVEACQSRLSIDGRVIAHLKWERGMGVEETRKMFTPGDVPQWYVNLVHGWIDSAYKAENPIEWFKAEWAACEGVES